MTSLYKKAKPVKRDEPTKPLAGGTLASPDTLRKSIRGKRFVFTAAQNNTRIHEDFFAGLLQFCEVNGARLVISQFTYNKNGFQNTTKDDSLWYDPRIREYVCNDSLQVASDLVFCGELNILPTASRPLSGLENYTQYASGIIPHAKVALESQPRMKNMPPRIMYTTGAVTQRNYIQKKSGQKAEFHHVFGALYVEIDDDGKWFARQLIANSDGVFHDLDKRYDGAHGTVTTVPVKAIQWGDIHIEKLDPEVAFGCWFNTDSMVTVLKPQYQLVHDLTDFTCRNHHNIKDPYHLATMRARGTDSVEDELAASADFLKRISTYSNVIVVESNHDQAFKRWLREAQAHLDPGNAELWHLYNAKIFSAIRKGNDRFNVYECALRTFEKLPKVKFLQEDDSFVLHDIECGMHGHRGPNGSRGNPKSFRSVGHKVAIGHMHSAQIIDGVYVAGVSALLDMDYNKGPSSWSHSHTLIYENGKRAIVTMRGTKWRA